MVPTLQSLGIDQLTVGERLELVQQIWDSIAADVEQTPLTDAEKAEVDRRLGAHENDPEAAIPWDQIEAEVLARSMKTAFLLPLGVARCYTAFLTKSAARIGSAVRFHLQEKFA